jgi:hypothetical protein
MTRSLAGASQKIVVETPYFSAGRKSPLTQSVTVSHCAMTYHSVFAILLALLMLFLIEFAGCPPQGWM